MGLGGGILGGIIGSFFGPWGTLIGAGIGYTVTGSSKKQSQSTDNDLDQYKVEKAFRIWFRSLGKLAKADGVVSQDEANFVQELLQSINNADHAFKQKLIEEFNAGKTDPRSMGDILADVAGLGNRDFREGLMESLCILAIADNQISDTERNMLSEAESVLRMRGYVNRFIRENCEQHSQKQTDSVAPDTLAEAYKQLGIQPSATDAEVRSAWRSKIMMFHPDKIQGKGLSEEFIHFAEEQTRKVNEAYELITKTRSSK